jgi:tRNA A-37 threonylcarbamoyl transferase component Bud32
VVERVGEHPGWEELEAYGQGRLAPERASALEGHLSGCASCCERLEKAPGDTFLSRLRAAESTAPGGPGRSTTDPAGAPPAPPAAPPELVDHPRYRVLGLLGQGGMGAVYRAEHRHMDRPVALKVIHPGLMRDPAAVRRFRQEVRAAARLHHPNIVTAHDADQAGGLHFLVMEYVEGTTLAELVRRRGPLPVPEACEYARQAALGLQHAHERGMVHRDIKPQNLMLTPGGQVKVLDFGLARLPRTPDGSLAGEVPAGPLTGAGAVMGTADYIAPEQAADPRGADIRADVYALGCTLFHLLAGRPPFPDGTVPEKLARHAGSAFPPVSALRPDVPAGLAAVLARMTARDPADRYQAPAEVAEALAPFCPHGRPRRRPARKRLLLAAVLALLAAGLLAGGVAWRLRDGRVEPVGQGGDGVEPPAPKKGGPSPEEAKAAEAFAKLGGRVRRDDLLPGKPVVAVDLSRTKVTDADLRGLTACKSLTVLHLGHTSVTDDGLKHLAGLARLKTLALTQTRVSDAGMEHVGGLKQLVALELQFTPVGDEGLKHLAGLTRLRTLSLYGTRVTDEGVEVVGRFKDLTFLSLDETAITDAGLKHLTGLGKLEVLGLFSTWAVGDEGMRSLARMKRLRSVDLCGTRVTDRGVGALARRGRLASIRLAGTKVTDAGVKELARLKDLGVLDLTNTAVTDEGLKDLARLRNLTNLNLQGAKQVTDAGVKQLAGLRRLQYLSLSGEGVTDVGLRELAGLPELEFLALMGANVTDTGLRELSRCAKLKYLRLTGCDKVTDAGVGGLKKALPNLQVQRLPR